MQSDEGNPEQPRPMLLRVGQDQRGRWLVQDIAGMIEGFFTSRESALGFAKSECEVFHGHFELSGVTLSSHLLH